MSIKKALFGGGVETSTTASYQGSIQDWLPVKNIIGGVVITKDNRFIKILEIVPVNISEVCRGPAGHRGSLCRISEDRAGSHAV